MFRYSDGRWCWSCIFIAAFMCAIFSTMSVAVFAIINSSKCTTDPICRAERDFRWEQKRISDQAQYEARLAELERTQ